MQPILKKLSETHILSLAMGLFGALILIFMWQANRGIVDRLIKNESLIDIASAMFWLTGSVICIYRIKTKSQNNKFLLYFWAVFCFLCCAEEVKWGYRIFNYSIDSLQQINYQHDISLHNLDLTSGWTMGPQRLFYLGFFIYFLIIPLLTISSKIKPIQEKFNYVTPSIYFLIAIWSNILLSVLIPHVFTPRIPLKNFYQVVATMAENREMFCAFIVLSYIFFYLPAGAKVIEVNNGLARSGRSTKDGQQADKCLGRLPIQKNTTDPDQLSQ